MTSAAGLLPLPSSTPDQPLRPPSHQRGGGSRTIFRALARYFLNISCKAVFLAVSIQQAGTDEMSESRPILNFFENIFVFICTSSYSHCHEKLKRHFYKCSGSHIMLIFIYWRLFCQGQESCSGHIRPYHPSPLQSPPPPPTPPHTTPPNTLVAKSAPFMQAQGI